MRLDAGAMLVLTASLRALSTRTPPSNPFAILSPLSRQQTPLPETLSTKVCRSVQHTVVHDAPSPSIQRYTFESIGSASQPKQESPHKCGHGGAFPSPDAMIRTEQNPRSLFSRELCSRVGERVGGGGSGGLGGAAALVPVGN